MTRPGSENLSKGRKTKDAYCEARLIALKSGELPVTELSDEELVRCRVSNEDGSFPAGRVPILPAKLQREMLSEVTRRAKDRVTRYGTEAIGILRELALTAENEGVRYQCAQLIAAYSIGKPMERVVILDEDPWDTILNGIMEDERDDVSGGDSPKGRRSRSKTARTD